MYKWRCPDCGRVGKKEYPDEDRTWHGLEIHFARSHGKKVPSSYYFQVAKTTVKT